MDAAASSYLTGYLAIAGGAAFLPADPADGRMLLEAFLLDRAIRETGDELGGFAEKLSLPLHAALRLLESPGSALEVWA